MNVPRGLLAQIRSEHQQKNSCELFSVQIMSKSTKPMKVQREISFPAKLELSTYKKKVAQLNHEPKRLFFFL